MSEVLKRPAASADLLEIWLYVANDSTERADRLLDSIDEQLQRLAHHPQIGRERPELAEGLRSFPAGSYVIYYRPLPDRRGIEVARILHGARDVPGAFGF